MHFVTVARLFELLGERDLKPMAPLLEIWQAKGVLVADAKAEPPGNGNGGGGGGGKAQGGVLAAAATANAATAAAS